MSESLRRENQPFSVSLANTQGFDLETIIVRWADLILSEQTGMTKRQRDTLHDIKRRASSVNRSLFATVMDLSRFATVRAATYGPEMFRGLTIAQLDLALPPVDLAYDAEDDTNSLVNKRQRRYQATRAWGDGEDACEGFWMQECATRIAADATYRAMRERRTIHVVSR